MSTQPPPQPQRPTPPFPLDIPALNDLRGKRIILASASPRRRALLAQLGLSHNLTVAPSHFAEDLPKSRLSPLEYVLQTATQKALSAYSQALARGSGDGDGEDGDGDGEPPALLLAADTIVVSPTGAILEKPRSEAEHVRMLMHLRDAAEGGAPHKVYTAVACMAPLPSAVDPGYAMETAVEETSVWFDRRVTDDLIHAYVRTREGADKAGGYGIQGMGAILIERIEGTFDNVVGLPLRATLQLIEKVMMPEEERNEALMAGEEEEEEDDNDGQEGGGKGRG